MKGNETMNIHHDSLSAACAVSYGMIKLIYNVDDKQDMLLCNTVFVASYFKRTITSAYSSCIVNFVCVVCSLNKSIDMYHADAVSAKLYQLLTIGLLDFHTIVQILTRKMKVK